MHFNTIKQKRQPTACRTAKRGLRRRIVNDKITPYVHLRQEARRLLTLRQITKVYSGGGMQVNALRGIDLEFGESEFAAILGPSGCGKTTLLNIIGGLDQYTDGDLIIRGKSTKQFTESDWDTYRNHAVGFVFQSYNLIPHQTVLANVELALTLSGIGREERRRRATEALARVGLADQVRKKPNELSGGQMQRVAIARALVNDPEVLLADEPTGALDSETSIQVMEILKEVARERLVIMVTHNPELADEYADRIIRVLDGKVISDSRTGREAPGEKADKEDGKKKRSMSILTALNLSLTNLMTKKGRTLLTAFAGSIGIIGIALILSISHGVDTYINRVQRDTLSSYPLEIESHTMDMTETLNSLSDVGNANRETEEGKVYSGSRMTNTMSSWVSGYRENDLESFKKWLDDPANGIDRLVSGIQYEYTTPLTIYRTDGEGIVQVNPSTTMEASGMMDMLNTGAAMGGIQQNMMDTFMKRMDVFNPLLDNEELIRSQYDILTGRLPQEKNEVVLILNSRNELSDYALYSLGLKDQGELRGQFNSLMQGKPIESVDMEFTYEDLMNITFRMLPDTEKYVKTGSIWKDMSGDEEYMRQKLAEAEEIRIVGILRPSEGTVATSSGNIGYRRELMEEMIRLVADSEIVKEQLANPDTDVFTGQPFNPDEEDALALLDTMDPVDFITLMEEKGVIPSGMIPDMYKPLLTKDLLTQFLQKGTMMISGNTLEANLEKLGVSDEDKPSSILIYPKDFESKDTLSRKIREYNAAAGEEKAIHYTDLMELLMSSVTTIVNAVSYVLIAFVAISLVVSSIMIGIITYISVLERTKEIGILRSVGASRRDVARVFNAETLIVGFAAGVIGIGVTLILVVIANIILKSVTGIPGLAILPPTAAVILVAISMILTLIAGIIPSQVAARKDPVVALRTE